MPRFISPSFGSPYACSEGQCLGPLTSVGNVTGSFVTNGARQTVPLTGGSSAPSTGPVTVTARTFPRHTAREVDLRYNWRSATQISTTETLFMALDPNTPAGQSDYDQWTVDIPAQTSGRQVEFTLEASGYGSEFFISRPGPTTLWSYTSN
jgi:hypothetical protein